jgi:uncharacterized membrane protein
MVLVASLAVVFAVAVAEGAWIVAGFVGIIGLVTTRSLLGTSRLAAQDRMRASIAQEN